MSLASLLIEEEIKEVIAEAKKQWKEGYKPKQLTLLPEFETPKLEQLNLFDVAGITDEDFWNQAEGLVFEALREYANKAAGSERLLRQLFADDAVQGFGFVDICRKKFDVVLMNPPFAAASKVSKSMIDSDYPLNY